MRAQGVAVRLECDVRYGWGRAYSTGLMEATQERWLPLAQALSLAEQQRAGGRLDAAEGLCRRILEVAPGHAGALHSLAIVLHDKGDLARAIEALERAIAVKGDVPLYHANLAEMCRRVGRLDEAITAGERALALKPDDPFVLNNLGIAHYDRDEYDRAVECYRRALALAPGSAQAHNNLGNAVLAQGDATTALTCYRRAVLLKPDYVDAHNNLAMTLLLAGDFEAGWRELEWRHRRAGRAETRFRQPQWRGEAFAGKTLLVQAEEGHGDAIHFLRYLPDVAARGGKVVLAAHRPLVRLARDLAPAVDVMTLGEKPPPFDLQINLMSLPLVFGTTLASVPAEVPYLAVDAGLAERWGRRLAAGTALRVGIVWSGALQYGHNRHRAIPAERLAPLLEIDGITWFSLQVGEPATQLARLPPGKITDLSGALADFGETAGAILALDLVISTDTAVPHLAGALAQPVWVMLAFMPDWRWLLGRDTSPWYPTMRLFRQPRPGDWPAVVERVAVELRRLLGGERQRLLPSAGGKAV